MMRPLPTLTRWGRRSTLLAGTSLRFECSPPSLRQSPDGTPWQRLMFWLMAPAPQDAAPPTNRLPVVRREFMAAMADVTSTDAKRLRWRVQEARSLRELWHVRADLYRVVAVAQSQVEAEERLLLLNRHFPTRAPRSQFGAF